MQHPPWEPQHRLIWWAPGRTPSTGQPRAAPREAGAPHPPPSFLLPTALPSPCPHSTSSSAGPWRPPAVVMAMGVVGSQDHSIPELRSAQARAPPEQLQSDARVCRSQLCAGDSTQAASFLPQNPLKVKPNQSPVLPVLQGLTFPHHLHSCPWGPGTAFPPGGSGQTMPLLAQSHSLEGLQGQGFLHGRSSGS